MFHRADPGCQCGAVRRPGGELSRARSRLPSPPRAASPARLSASARLRPQDAATLRRLRPRLAPLPQDFPLQALDDDCRLLGSILDDTLRIECGDVLFEKIERIRSMAQAAASLGQGHAGDAATLLHSLTERELMSMSLQEALPTTRALGHYLNLTSLAETYHNLRLQRQQLVRRRDARTHLLHPHHPSYPHPCLPLHVSDCVSHVL